MQNVTCGAFYSQKTVGWVPQKGLDQAYYTSWLIHTAFVALASTLVATILQSTKGMSTKQLSYPGMDGLSFIVLSFGLINTPSIF